MISVFSLLSLLSLSLSLLSMWIRRSFWVWGSLLTLSLYFGSRAGMIAGDGIMILAGWILLWLIYIAVHPKYNVVRWGFLLLFILCSFGFKFHLFPGFHPFVFTPRFQLGFETAFLGLCPLALVVPLLNRSTRLKEWKKMIMGLLLGVFGIGVLSLIAMVSGSVHWQYTTPSHAAIRYLSNLILVAIPEEAFYRGFIQKELCRYLAKWRMGKWLALTLSSLLFTTAHIYWSPSLDILGFVFLAGLLYGGVYLFSQKIESAILCHFLLNFTHMTFFSYHAM